MFVIGSFCEALCESIHVFFFDNLAHGGWREAGGTGTEDSGMNEYTQC